MVLCNSHPNNMIWFMISEKCYSFAVAAFPFFLSVNSVYTGQRTRWQKFPNYGVISKYVTFVSCFKFSHLGFYKPCKNSGFPDFFLLLASSVIIVQ